MTKLHLLTVLFLQLLSTVAGNLSATFGRCCASGVNWAHESQDCSSFSTTVAAIPTEHQAICITTANICCLRYFRNEQCDKGKQAAWAGKDCVAPSTQGGEYFKDCCQGCKLGLLSRSMSLDCGRHFKFGLPWDNGFLECCNQNSISSNPSDVDECSAGVANCSPEQICYNTPGSFECRDECKEGFRYDPTDGKGCVNINECLESPCSSGEDCYDTEGGYFCIPATTTSSSTTPLACPHGYKRDHNNLQCEDIDECAVDDTCDEEQSCFNTPGSYTCRIRRCPDGYQKSYWGRCRDVNECESGEHTCNFPKEECINLEGSYECRPLRDCNEGFTRDPQKLRCVDIDECAEGSHECVDGERCSNQYGGYTCVGSPTSCTNGFRYNWSTKRCKDIDECLENSGTCDRNTQTCINSQGTFRCIDRKPTCDFGYSYDEDFEICIDIDECTEDNPCQRNKHCKNTLGSYECYPKLDCHSGFEMNEAGTHCVDINECAKGIDKCEENQICSNTHGTYMCHCPDGFRLNAQRQCQDIDECERYFGSVCASNSKCENTPGSYRCKCKEGFKETDNTCIDVNECEETPNICQHRCINVWGTYQCTCRPGYLLNADNRTCSDVDECENSRGRFSLCIGLCVNVPGSFECTCPDGYTLAADGRTCKDNNECEARNVCRAIDELCVNTNGGYKCKTITCPPHYVRDRNRKNRCNRNCNRYDDACRQKPSAFSYNFLALVSNTNLPSLIFTMNVRQRQGTTMQFDLELEDVQVPSGVSLVTKDYFQLRYPDAVSSQVAIYLVKPIVGPQEILLSLNVKLYKNGQFSQSVMVKNLIYVSEYYF